MLAAVGMVFTACEGNGDIEEENGDVSIPKIELSQQSIEVDFEPNTYTVSVTSPYSWEAKSDNDWIIVETKTGIAGTKELSFTVERNVEEEIRKGTITVMNSTYNLATEFYVTQKYGAKRVIFYTTSDNKVITPYETDAFGANIVSNTYENGKGIIKFDAPVTSIGEDAFRDCSSLTSITIPYSVTSIGAWTFYYCSSLASVTIPDSVTSIGWDAFRGCSSLTSVTIGNSVTSIGSYAFSGCNSLTSVTIPDSVTSIGNYAFSGCSSLTSVTIGNSVTSIGEYAFASCSSLTSVTIPDSVTSIGSDAFYTCSSLASVTIGNTVTEIGSSAFYKCSSLKNVYCKPTTPPSGRGYMFNDNASGRKIYVPTASVEAYKSAQYWSNYASYIVGYDF